MTFNSTPSKGHKSLRPGDSDFTFSPDGVMLVCRAEIEVSNDCPAEYRHLIAVAFNNGWLKAVANMRNTEYLVEILR